MNKTRNIIAVYRVSADSMSETPRVDTDGVHVSPSIPFQKIDIRVPARLTVTDKIDNGVRMYNAQLVFKTCEEISDRERIVYICKASNGNQYLIGTKDRPYPVTTVNEPHPDNMTDSQLNEVTVNWTSSKKIPYII